MEISREAEDEQLLQSNKHAHRVARISAQGLQNSHWCWGAPEHQAEALPMPFSQATCMEKTCRVWVSP